jgi:hypothetical protein
LFYNVAPRFLQSSHPLSDSGEGFFLISGQFFDILEIEERRAMLYGIVPKRKRGVALVGTVCNSACKRTTPNHL